MFYSDSTVIYNAFWADPATGSELIFLPTKQVSWERGYHASGIYFYGDPATYAAIRVGAFFSLFTLNSYSLITLGFAILSFSGVWRLFLVTCDLFPKHHRAIAFTVLFLPSTIFWGSGYMKDSLTLGALGWAIFGFYLLAIKRERTMTGMLSLLAGCYLLLIIKIYILLPFIIAAAIWLYSDLMRRITSAALRIAMRPLLAMVLLGLGWLGANSVSSFNEKYDVDQLVHTSNVTANYLQYTSMRSGGNAYELSEIFDGSLRSFLVLFPQAVNVSFFRPFLWEARNPVMLLSALENTLILLLTLRLVVLVFQSRFWRTLRSTPYFSFCLIYSLFFGFAIGVSTYNFGSLMRYRIPLLPLLLPMLVILYREVAARTEKERETPGESGPKESVSV